MEALFCSLTTDMTDDEIKECIHRMHPRAVKSGQGFLLTISGYDRDPRDLWEIPNDITFFNKLIDIGFLSVLAINAQAVMPGTPGFGAMEVWMIATGKITRRAKVPITPEDFKTVLRLVEESNVKCAEILNQPCPETGIKEHEEIIGKAKLQEVGKVLRTIQSLDGKKPVADGQHAHGDRWWNHIKGDIR